MCRTVIVGGVREHHPIRLRSSISDVAEVPVLARSDSCAAMSEFARPPTPIPIQRDRLHRRPVPFGLQRSDRCGRLACFHDPWQSTHAAHQRQSAAVMATRRPVSQKESGTTARCVLAPVSLNGRTAPFGRSERDAQHRSGVPAGCDVVRQPMDHPRASEGTVRRPARARRGARMMRRQRPRSQEISPAGAGPGLSGDVRCGRVGGGALGGVGGRGWSPPPTAFAATSDTGAPGAGSAWRRWGR